MQTLMAAAAAAEILMASLGLATMLAVLALRGAFWLMPSRREAVAGGVHRTAASARLAARAIETGGPLAARSALFGPAALLPVRAEKLREATRM